MSSDLKKLHPTLYARVRRLAIANFLLGVAVVFTGHSEHLHSFGVHTGMPDAARLNGYIPYDVWGLIWIIVGAVIFYGLYRPRKTYQFDRIALLVAFIYALFWFVSLIVTVFTGRPQTLSVLILWWYFTFTMLSVAKDTGWRGASLVKKIRESNGL